MESPGTTTPAKLALNAQARYHIAGLRIRYVAKEEHSDDALLRSGHLIAARNLSHLWSEVLHTGAQTLTPKPPTAPAPALRTSAQK